MSACCSLLTSSGIHYQVHLMWVGEGNFTGKKSFEVHTIPESVDDVLRLCPVLEMSFLLAVCLPFAFFFFLVRPF